MEVSGERRDKKKPLAFAAGPWFFWVWITQRHFQILARPAAIKPAPPCLRQPAISLGDVAGRPLHDTKLSLIATPSRSGSPAVPADVSD
jgi:hypothetical protein